MEKYKNCEECKRLNVYKRYTLCTYNSSVGLVCPFINQIPKINSGPDTTSDPDKLIPVCNFQLKLF